MFKCLLASGDQFLTVSHERRSNKLAVSVDQTKISIHGRPALAELLLKLHIYRCTADVEACRSFYNALTEPEHEFLDWRRIMLAQQPAKQVFVQPNTFIKDGQVVLKEYEASVDGMLQSWAERTIGMDLVTES